MIIRVEMEIDESAAGNFRAITRSTRMLPTKAKYQQMLYVIAAGKALIDAVAADRVSVTGSTKALSIELDGRLVACEGSGE